MTDIREKAKTFVPFYESGAQIYMSLKLSKDGLSRVEDTDVLKGMYEESRGFNTGFPLIQALEDQTEPTKGWRKSRGGETR